MIIGTKWNEKFPARTNRGTSNPTPSDHRPNDFLFSCAKCSIHCQRIELSFRADDRAPKISERSFEIAKYVSLNFIQDLHPWKYEIILPFGLARV